ncbi:hypothetical protein HQN90_07565 [Paenibacillus alba]|nr:hypothetical protein [Paenibacillus alba]
MEPCFLLTGKPRVGKSTSIKRIIQQIGPEYFGGFYTEEIRNSTNRTGFNCITLHGETVCMASVYSESSVRVGRYGVDIVAFENIALNALTLSLSVSTTNFRVSGSCWLHKKRNGLSQRTNA